MLCLVTCFLSSPGQVRLSAAIAPPAQPQLRPLLTPTVSAFSLPGPALQDPRFARPPCLSRLSSCDVPLGALVQTAPDPRAPFPLCLLLSSRHHLTLPVLLIRHCPLPQPRTHGLRGQGLLRFCRLLWPKSNDSGTQWTPDKYLLDTSANRLDGPSCRSAWKHGSSGSMPGVTTGAASYEERPRPGQ